MQKAAPMNDQVITGINQLSREWFEKVLSQSEALTGGGVRDFKVDLSTNVWSTSARIRLEYQPGSTGTLPTRLFLKMCRAGESGFGPSEVNYYRRDYLGVADAPLPKCYDAAYSDELQCYHLLLEDLSESHRICWDLAPNLNFGKRLAAALAALHAPWWETEHEQSAGAWLEEVRTQLGRYFEHIEPGLPFLLDEIKAETDPAWQTIITTLFEKFPAKMRERTTNPQGFTLTHGDPNPGNTLWPVNNDGPLYLIDRQPFDWSLITWLGVSDLSYAIVTWWEPEQRRELEFPILRHYHQSLLARGVKGYSWEQLVYDYKLSALQTFYVAAEWCVEEKTRQDMRWVWFPELKRAMAAYSELDCAELLG
jgi:thiamine kinase-like enzyme